MTRPACPSGSAARYALGVGLALFASSALVARQQGAAQTLPPPPQFRSEANLVHVDAYPRRAGRIVDDLTAADFEILEDGKPQKVENLQFVRVEGNVPESERRDPNNTREMLQAAADPANRVFVVFLDTDHVQILNAARARTPLIRMLNRMLAPNDLFGVLTPDVPASQLTLGRRALAVEEMLNDNWNWGKRDSMYRDPIESQIESCFSNTGKIADGAESRGVSAVVIDRLREDKVLTRLDELVHHLADIREERKALLLFSEGWVLYQPDPALALLGRQFSDPPRLVTIDGRPTLSTTIPGLGDAWCNNQLQAAASLDDARHMRNLIDLARQSNVAFYPVNPAGLTAGSDTPIAQQGNVTPSGRGADAGAAMLNQEIDRLAGRTTALMTLAENTDGVAAVNSNDLDVGIGRIVDDLSAYYVLGYYSTNTANDGKYRRIDVKVKQPGVVVAARHGYTAPSAAEMAARRSIATSASAAATVTAGFDVALASLARLASSSDLFTRGVMRDGEMVVAVELAGPLLADPRWTTGAQIAATVSGANGDIVGSGQGRLVAGADSTELHVPLTTAGAGPWQVRVRVKSDADDRTDVADVPVDSGSLLGSPLLYRASPAGNAPLRPAASFGFRRTERVHIECPITRALDERQARLLDRAGHPVQAVLNVTERSTGDHSVLAIDLSLGSLGPGDYLLEITAGAGTTTDRKLIAIRITP